MRERNWFSNFLEFDSPLVYQGLSFHTPEHFFQAMKCEKNDIEGRRKLASAPSPAVAKRLGRTVKLRPDWENIKLEVMEYALRYKFAPGTSWHEKLMQEKGEIVEVNHWHDNFWGSCTCSRCQDRGKNYLGRILMKIRDGK